MKDTNKMNAMLEEAHNTDPKNIRTLLFKAVELSIADDDIDTTTRNRLEFIEIDEYIKQDRPTLINLLIEAELQEDYENVNFHCRSLSRSDLKHSSTLLEPEIYNTIKTYVQH